MAIASLRGRRRGLLGKTRIGSSFAMVRRSAWGGRRLDKVGLAGGQRQA
jgi:hypothetical protein